MNNQKAKKQKACLQTFSTTAERWQVTKSEQIRDDIEQQFFGTPRLLKSRTAMNFRCYCCEVRLHNMNANKYRFLLLARGYNNRNKTNPA